MSRSTSDSSARPSARLAAELANQISPVLRTSTSATGSSATTSCNSGSVSEHANVRRGQSRVTASVPTEDTSPRYAAKIENHPARFAARGSTRVVVDDSDHWCDRLARSTDRRRRPPSRFDLDSQCMRRVADDSPSRANSRLTKGRTCGRPRTCNQRPERDIAQTVTTCFSDRIGRCVPVSGRSSPRTPASFR